MINRWFDVCSNDLFIKQRFSKILVCVRRQISLTLKTAAMPLNYIFLITPTLAQTWLRKVKLFRLWLSVHIFWRVGEWSSDDSIHVLAARVHTESRQYRRTFLIFRETLAQLARWCYFSFFRRVRQKNSISVFSSVSLNRSDGFEY